MGHGNYLSRHTPLWDGIQQRWDMTLLLNVTFYQDHGQTDRVADTIATLATAKKNLLSFQ